MHRNAAVIVAGGVGSRVGGEVPKQYMPLGGMPVIRRTVLAFLKHPRIARVQVVARPADRALYDAALGDLDLPPPAEAGADRQQSVRAGLAALSTHDIDAVLIHDAARPLVDAATIHRTLEALETHDGAIAALPVTDSLKRGDGTLIAGSVDRAGLWRAQTPQTFRYGAIVAAHEAAAGLGLGDDAAVAERAGLAVSLVLGSEYNLKITNADDFTRAARFLEDRLDDIRVGTGFDAHRLGPGDSVWLCGVNVPFSQGLVGHSDADVGLHALTDAILGAIGDGDIGQHFPPSDPRWKGASSDRFLADAARRVAERGGVIAHVDVTLICEAPKVAPQRAAMIAAVARILGLPEARVSVKATTTERMGFTGRGEGIAAQAAATVRLPSVSGAAA